MKLGLDFKKIATKAAGHGVGAAIAGKLNSIGFINKIADSRVQGAVKAAIGYGLTPVLAKKMGFTGKGKGELVEAIGEGIGMIGILQIGRAVAPQFFPAVAGVAGYEENPIQGLGELYDSDGVSGYEDSPMSGYEDSPMAGYEDSPMSGLDDMSGTDDFE